MDAQVLPRISTRTPLSVNATTGCADVSAQYELLGGKQRTLDGRWEPPRYRQRPEPVEGVADEATAELFDEGRRQPTLPPTRPKGGLEKKCDNAAAAPLGDPSALPKNSYFAEQLGLLIRLMEYGISLPPGQERARVELLIDRQDGCGARAIPGHGFVTFHAGLKGSAYVGGVIWCGRWLCPACGPFAQRRRREALAARAPVVAAAGNTFLFTPTLRHKRGVKYVTLRHALAAITRSMKKHRQWRAVLADVRADEVTYGRNGWHLHKHILLTLPKDADADAFRDWLEEFWAEEARKQGRTCEWFDGWWKRVEEGEVAAKANYLQKLGSEENATGDTVASVMAGEVLGATAKLGVRPWDLEAKQYVEAWFGSLRQRTFAVGGLWRTKTTAAVESEEDAAGQREQAKPSFARALRNVWRELDPDTRRWVKGSLANAALRPDWILRLESVFGPDLEVLCQPGETPPPTPPQTPPDAPDDDEPVSDPTGDPQGVLDLPPPAVSLAQGCGGDAPTEAQGAAADGTDASVAPQPVSERQVIVAPRQPLEEATYLANKPQDSCCSGVNVRRLGATDALASTVGADKHVPPAVDAADTFTSAVGTGKHVPPAVDTTDALASTVGTGKHVPPAVDAADALPSTVGTGKHISPAIDAAETLASTIGAAKQVSHWTLPFDQKPDSIFHFSVL